VEVGQCSEVWHLSHFLVLLFNFSIGSGDTFVHSLLESSHLSFDFLDGFLVAIVIGSFLLSNLLGWLVGQLFLLQSDFLFDSSLTFFKLALKLPGEFLGLSNSLNMLTVFIDGWVLLGFLLLKSLFLSSSFSSFFQLVRFLLSSGHLRLIWVELLSSSSQSSSLVDIWGV